jgi:plastocyanin
LNSHQPPRTEQLTLSREQTVGGNNNNKQTIAISGSNVLPIMTSPLTTVVSSFNKEPQKLKYVDIPFGAGKRYFRPEYFIPSSIVINSGDTVIWTNKDTVSHTVTAVAFDSGSIWPQGSANGPSAYSHTFLNPGVYSYFCQIHPYMSGTVYVNTQETLRQLTSMTNTTVGNAMIEMPYGTAYHNNFKQGFFIPGNAIVKAGSRVTWVNHDYIAHTATATDGSFDTGVVDTMQTRTLIMNEDPERLAYYCRIHPWMQGSITILPSS